MKVLEHAYDRPDISPRDFLLAVMCDPTVDDDLRIRAATYLQEYDIVSGYHPPFPEDKTPIDYVAPPPKAKRKHRKVQDANNLHPATSRDDWLFLKSHHEYMRDTGIRTTESKRMRDRIVIRNPAIPPRSTDISKRI